MRADDFLGICAVDLAHTLPWTRRGVVMVRVLLMLSTFVALTAISASSGEQLRIAVTPAQSFAPSNLNIRARVVRDAENRALTVVAESEEFYRSSQVPLEGEQAPSTIMFQFRGVPDGEYQVYAILTDSVGHQRAIAQQTVRVIPSGLGQ